MCERDRDTKRCRINRERAENREKATAKKGAPIEIAS